MASFLLAKISTLSLLVADLYITLFDSILNGQDTAHGVDGIYFAENDQFEFMGLYKAAGQVLFDSGRISSPDPIPYTAEEIKASPMVRSFRTTSLKKLMPIHSQLGMSGINSRCIADRSRALGWKPVKKNKVRRRRVTYEIRRPMIYWNRTCLRASELKRTPSSPPCDIYKKSCAAGDLPGLYSLQCLNLHFMDPFDFACSPDDLGLRMYCYHPWMIDVTINRCKAGQPRSRKKGKSQTTTLSGGPR